MNFQVVIPARYGSSRFPGKPLAEIAGWPMVRHVVERGRESGAGRVTVATDDERIEARCRELGVDVVMTRADHTSGTDRLAEVVSILGLDDDEVVVNVQGDEPLMPPAFIRTLVTNLEANPETSVATLVTPLHGADELHDPNVVKVVRSRSGHALYFSRAPIPWDRERQGRPQQLAGWWRHLGIYAYRAGFLRGYPALEPAPLEETESLEQLRVLWHGLSIHAAEVHGDAGPGVDTPADLERVAGLLREG
ncbi:3-deoxy-manno-octulosonate cytidylyltransferase [Aquisalimonas sp. 2447]|uniref:3-deoxy-manno-octulosonate cytidylyltransferase n=1 Tax=Aquisalimonas sp. 2447 TaxID=2740807 RepID=UPI0014323399|nr:3-deoxy-manno-octulosonate cytidylyltransferase [Aquisalimonas sp. 2447]QIT55518.1 3-deoxy-manno-octulosonate cytidylyltransferase [Aquisalimonas sp. 2447]